MTLTLELPAAVEQALTARAQARGLALPEYLKQLMAHAVENKEALPKLPPTPEAIARSRHRKEQEQRYEERLRQEAETEVDAVLIDMAHKEALATSQGKRREAYVPGEIFAQAGTDQPQNRLSPEQKIQLDKEYREEIESRRQFQRNHMIERIIWEKKSARRTRSAALPAETSTST